jgi:hypothetical protein
MGTYYQLETYQETVDYLKSRLPPSLQRVQLGIVCGSGLGGLEHTLEEPKQAFAYKDIPHFAQSTGTYSTEKQSKDMLVNWCLVYCKESLLFSWWGAIISTKVTPSSKQCILSVS